MQLKKEVKQSIDLKKVVVRIIAGICALLIAGSAFFIAFSV